MEIDILDHVRIDKWMWAVRIFKSRSMATEACKNGKVTVNGNTVKPSHIVKPGEIIEVKNPFLLRSFHVKGILEKRVSAKLAVEYMEETTAPEEFEKMKALRSNIPAYRSRGSGRPTKRERRHTDRWKKITPDL